MTTVERKVSYSGFRFSVALLTNENGSLGPLRGHNLDTTFTFVLEGEERLPDIHKWLDRITKFLDHRTVVARDQPGLTLAEEGETLTLGWLDSRVSLPKDEVCVLPLPDTQVWSILGHLGQVVLDAWELPARVAELVVGATDLPYRQYEVRVRPTG